MTGQAKDDELEPTPAPAVRARGRTAARSSSARRLVTWVLLLAAAVCVPGLYWLDWISIETVRMMGRYLALAMVALSLDLLWGYTGMLCLCQSFFFSLGGYAMGM